MCFKKLFGRTPILDASTYSGKPSFSEGGLDITFTISGMKDSDITTISFGDGSSASIIGNSFVKHLYDRVGDYLVVARSKGKEDYAAIKVIANPCPLYGIFVKCPISIYEGVGLSGKKRVVGCEGGQKRYGAWPRPGELIRHEWEVYINELDLSVYGYGTWENPLESVKWYVADTTPPPLDSDSPVLTPDGIWMPGDDWEYSSLDCDLPEIHAVITHRIFNQFGSVSERKANVTASQS